MRPPLDNWSSRKRGYRFGQKTSYSSFHLGLDISGKVGDKVYAPVSGTIIAALNGKEGGLTIWLKTQNNSIIRFLHLSKILQYEGYVSEGEVIGLLGNTGTLTTGPHVHVDISKNGRVELRNPKNFVDPEEAFLVKDRAYYESLGYTYISTLIMRDKLLKSGKKIYHFGKLLFYR